MVLSKIVNAMSVDVEDYFQVSAFESVVNRQDWDSMEHRVESNTHDILDLFASHNVKSTFFMLGWVAERYPGLLTRIVSEGHELASHGYDHIRATQQTPDEFFSDVVRTKQLLEDISGVEVRGYRAASYSISEKNIWAIDKLQEAGYQYSSSIYPIKHDLYGMPSAPRFAFNHKSNNLLEIPISTTKILGKKLPCGGGGFFRLYPYVYSKWAIKTVNKKEKQPVIFYFHPWEIDYYQPRVPNLPFKSKFRHYLNLRHMRGRLARLLEDFKWGRLDDIFLG